MITLSNLRPQYGSKRKRKLVGRGEGTGHGGSATRGTKGQKARSGDGKMTGFEGGQMTLARRIPKRGFNHKRFSAPVSVVNLKALAARFPSKDTIKPGDLFAGGLADSNAHRIKILGEGTLTRPLKVYAHAFSRSAAEKLKAAGGEAIILQEIE